MVHSELRRQHMPSAADRRGVGEGKNVGGERQPTSCKGRFFC